VPGDTLVNDEPVDRLGGTLNPIGLVPAYGKRVDGFKRSSEMTKTRKNEGAKIKLSHRYKSRNSLGRDFHNVGRGRFTLAFKTANQADFEQIFSQIQAEVELWLSSK